MFAENVLIAWNVRKEAIKSSRWRSWLASGKASILQSDARVEGTRLFLRMALCMVHVQISKLYKTEWTLGRPSFAMPSLDGDVSHIQVQQTISYIRSWRRAVCFRNFYSLFPHRNMVPHVTALLQPSNDEMTQLNHRQSPKKWCLVYPLHGTCANL